MHSTPYVFEIMEHNISYNKKPYSISIKFLFVITTFYKTESKKREIEGIEPSPFGSKGHTLLQV